MICSTQQFNSCPIGCTQDGGMSAIYLPAKSVTNESNSWAIFTSTKHGTSSPLKTIKKQPSYHLINNHLKSISFWSLQSWSIRHEAGEGRCGGGHAHTQWQQRLKASNHIDLLPTWLTPCTVRFSDNAHAHQYTKIYVHALFTHRRRHPIPPSPVTQNSNF